MKNNLDDLTQDEQDILSHYNNGRFQSISNPDERRDELQSAVGNTLNKTRNINIRITEKDLVRLKAKAIEEGMPYQTLVSSILHKAASSYLTEGHYPLATIRPTSYTAGLTVKEFSIE